MKKRITVIIIMCFLLTIAAAPVYATNERQNPEFVCSDVSAEMIKLLCAVQSGNIKVIQNENERCQA